MDNVLTENIKNLVIKLQSEIAYKFDNSDGHWGEIDNDGEVFAVKFHKPYNKETLEAELYDVEFNAEGKMKVNMSKRIWTLQMRAAGFEVYDFRDH